MKIGRIVLPCAFCLLFFFLCQPIAFSAELTVGERRRIESGAISAFEAIVSLWKSERFDEIYEYGDKISREMMPREKFASEMRISWCVLASSWETIRDIEAKVISPTRAQVKARMGFEKRGWGEARFFTQVFSMTLDKGEWRIALHKLLHCPWMDLPP